MTLGRKHVSQKQDIHGKQGFKKGEKSFGRTAV